MKRETIFNEVYDSQRSYRLLLDSMARPGKVNTLFDIGIDPPVELGKGSALVAMTLLNADVSFCYIGNAAEIVNSYLILNTSSSPVDADKTDFLFIDGDGDSDILSSLKIGTLSYPEEGATAVVRVASISEVHVQGSLKLSLKGPGVKSITSVFIVGLSTSIIETVSSINSEFPLGVDLILADEAGRLVCIPRSNTISFER